MKCTRNIHHGIALFFLFLSLCSISCIERSKTSKKVKKVNKNIDPNHLAIAVLMSKMGSRQTVHKIVIKLSKKCKNLKILQRTKTSIHWLRNKFGYVRKALKTDKVNKDVKKTLYKNFYSRLFSRLLKCSVISNSKVAWQLKKAVKLLKNGKRLPGSLKNIRKLVNITNAKAKPKKGFFNAVKKYYKFLGRKKQIKKILKQKGPNPLQKNKKSLTKANNKIKKVDKLSMKIKKNLKICVMFKGKFAKKACKKVRIIRAEMRRISKKLYRKLRVNCKSAKTYCIARGNQKFCRNAHKICQKTKKLKGKISKSRLQTSASNFGRILSKLISKFINNH